MGVTPVAFSTKAVGDVARMELLPPNIVNPIVHVSCTVGEVLSDVTVTFRILGHAVGACWCTYIILYCFVNQGRRKKSMTQNNCYRVCANTWVGSSVGTSVGDAVVGVAVGITVGVEVGLAVGCCVGVEVGLALGLVVGCWVGPAVGKLVALLWPSFVFSQSVSQ